MPLSYCNSESTFILDFSTEALPGPTVDLTGRSYTVDLTDGQTVQPPAISSVLASLWERPLLISVGTQTESSLELAAGIAEEGSDVQDTCIATGTFSTTSINGSTFAAVGTSLSVPVENVAIWLYDLQATGIFAVDGST